MIIQMRRTPLAELTPAELNILKPVAPNGKYEIA